MDKKLGKPFTKGFAQPVRKLHFEILNLDTHVICTKLVKFHIDKGIAAKPQNTTEIRENGSWEKRGREGLRGESIAHRAYAKTSKIFHTQLLKQPI